tara:strand:+ start:556 stop:741 length:186 start_codon:yes stop_codon:yes gene_type:complete
MLPGIVVQLVTSPYKLNASLILLTKILVHFLSGLYLLNLLLKHATNYTQQRCASLSETANQ